LQLLIIKRKKQISAEFTLNFLLIKTLDSDPEPDPYPNSLEMLDLDPYPDPNSTLPARTIKYKGRPPSIFRFVKSHYTVEGLFYT
jgi:hypothetical protein